ncbi:phosphatidate cytidylyltransferase [Thiomicrorhabdus aquaedulcis]|uniref:phosphatidate cytidylyltransferase n=1 Tax=Thiomicrorhabdus aquaedulcis TaxID=2211106 RepID=UPI001561B17C|nr:phosphatidate cytidylyltransferase [Thiomicrorhabdus aquaedulcis]
MLKQRVITALLLASAFTVALFWSPLWLWQTLMLLLAGLAAWEWSSFAGLDKQWHKLLYVLGVMGTFGLGLEWLDLKLIVLLTMLEAFALFFIVIRYQRSKGQSGVNSSVVTALMGVLSIVLFTVLMARFRTEFSPELLLVSLMVIWAVDTGAYFSGRRFGKTKLAQFVSPGKTWEGVWGGTVLAFVVAVLGLFLLSSDLKWNLWIMATLLALIALFSVVGDLFESVLKRQAGLKDSGSILPGHGGILDRVDSLLIAVPMLYIAWVFAKGVI